jgi:hypothetical protein
MEKKTLLLLLLSVFGVSSCKKDPIELTNPDVYPLKYIFQDLQREKDLVFVIKDDKGNYEPTKSDPLANKKDGKYINSNDYIQVGGLSGITLKDLSNATAHDNSGAHDMTYTIKGNEVNLSQVQGRFYFNENKYTIKWRLAMVGIKTTDGKSYGYEGGFKSRRFDPFLAYSLEDLIKREIAGNNMKKNDTLYITEYWANFEKD